MLVFYILATVHGTSIVRRYEREENVVAVQHASAEDEHQDNQETKVHLEVVAEKKDTKDIVSSSPIKNRIETAQLSLAQEEQLDTTLTSKGEEEDEGEDFTYFIKGEYEGTVVENMPSWKCYPRQGLQGCEKQCEMRLIDFLLSDKKPRIDFLYKCKECCQPRVTDQ